MKLDNVDYDKVKLLYKMSRIVWFIEKHAAMEAKRAGDRELLELLEEIREKNEQFVEHLQGLICS